MKRFYKKIILICSVSCLCIGLHAQSLDQAKKLFAKEQYAEAKPAFERLIKTAPNNASYNHWYGVCSYKTKQYETAEKHLKVAVKRRVQEASRFLAELYFDTYRFKESEEMYDKYIELLTKKKKDTEVWELKKEEAQNAARMLFKTENIQIIDSVIVSTKNLLGAYQLSSESGSLAPFNDFFDTNNPESSIVYMNEKENKIFYGEKLGDEPYKLFTKSKLLDVWGDKKELPSNINRSKDTNYPFVLSDGATIYFSSKGNGSLGGYDLFVTRYNSSNDTYLAADQLGMPFNSLANDYMMVIDEQKNLGWFASDRNQPEGSVAIYLFIPNEERIDLITEESDGGDKLKRERAQISSIKDSWLPDTDYSKLIKLAHTDLSANKNTIEKEFKFAVTDDLIYYTMAQIQSPEARTNYEKVISINKQIKALNDKLDALRTTYNNEKGKRAKLSPTILSTEQRIESLINEPALWEKRARNAEIRFLNKK